MVTIAQPENPEMKLEVLVKKAVYEGWSDETLRQQLANDKSLSRLYDPSSAQIFRLIDGIVRIVIKSYNKTTCYKILKRIEEDKPRYNIYLAPWGPKDGDIVYAKKYNETHGTFFREYRISSRVLLEKSEEWVYVGTVSQQPPNYDPNIWRYEPSDEDVWIVKGLIEEEEAKSYKDKPEYKLEKDGQGIKFRQVNYFKVYRIVTRVLYHRYKWIKNPIREFIKNGRADSIDSWFFDKFGEALGELYTSDYISTPSCLRIITGPTSYGAWRQSFSYDGSKYPKLEFRYKLSGKGVVTIKTPSGEAVVIPLGASYKWAEFSRDVSDILVSPGEYEISFVAQKDSELCVDDVSLHTGGGGEWVYLGDSEKLPDEIPEDEDYKPFHKVEWKYVGTFNEQEVSSYSKSEYVIMFDHVDTITYYVDLYILYEKGKANVYNVYYKKTKEGAYYYWMEPTGRIVKEAHDYIVNEKICVEEEELSTFIEPDVLVEKEAEKWLFETYTFSEEEADEYRRREGYVVLNVSAIPWEKLYKIPVILDDTRIEGSGILGSDHILVILINNSHQPLRNYLVKMLDTSPREGDLNFPDISFYIHTIWAVEPKQNPVNIDNIPVGMNSFHISFQPYIYGRDEYGGELYLTDPELIIVNGKAWEPLFPVIFEVQLTTPRGEVIARYTVPFAFESGAWLYQNVYNKLPDWAKEVWNVMKEALPEILVLVVIYYCLPEALVAAGLSATEAAMITKCVTTVLYAFHITVGTFNEIMEIIYETAHAQEFLEEAKRLKELAMWADKYHGPEQEYQPRSKFSQILWEEAMVLEGKGSSAQNLANTLLRLGIGIDTRDIENVVEGIRNEQKRNKLYWRSFGKVLVALTKFFIFSSGTKSLAKRFGEHWSFTGAVKAWITPAFVDLLSFIHGKLRGSVDIKPLLELRAFVEHVSCEIGGRLSEEMKIAFESAASKLDDLKEAVTKKDIEDVFNDLRPYTRFMNAYENLINKFPEDTINAFCRKFSELNVEGFGKALEKISLWKEKHTDAVMRLVSKADLKKIEPEGILLSKILGLSMEVKEKVAEMVMRFGDTIDEDLATKMLDAALKGPGELAKVEEEIIEFKGLSRVFEFEAKPRKVTLKKGESSLFYLGSGGELEKGVYIIRIRWKYEGEGRTVSGEAEFPFTKETKSDGIWIPIREANKALDAIGKNEAEILITEVRASDYRLFFPSSFTVNGKQIRLDLFSNKIAFGANSYPCSMEADHIEEIVFVKATVESGDTMGKPLTLVFYDDGRVSTLVGHNKFPLEDIQVDAVNEAVTLIYVKEGSVCTPVYSLKAGDIKSAVNRAFKWKEDTKGREHIGLKEKLLVLLGYQAYQDLKEGIGRKYGILVEFDNGRKAYTGDESIAIHVPEGASKMETIVVTSIEEK
ncbi:MAG: hypothetical protein QXT87_05040, partial [Thermoproteota archaeon]